MGNFLRGHVKLCRFSILVVPSSGGSSESDLLDFDSVFGINSVADSDAGIDSNSRVDSGADFGVCSGSDSGVESGADTGVDFGIDSVSGFGIRTAFGIDRWDGWCFHVLPQHGPAAALDHPTVPDPIPELNPEPIPELTSESIP